MISWLYWRLFRKYNVGTACKAIALNDKQDGWIKAQIDAGRYTNDSEYIRDLIRREQERSGDPMPFDVGAFKRKMLAAHG